MLSASQTTVPAAEAATTAGPMPEAMPTTASTTTLTASAISL